MAYKNIAIIGGTGQLGGPILTAFIDSGKFNITAITRPESKATFPSGVKVIRADYKSVDEVSKALEGQDALVSAVASEFHGGQHIFVDAAIKAGVKRFIPSEFGSNLEGEKTRHLAVFGGKIATRKHLEEKIKGGADITYTYVINSGFYDWGLEVSFLLNWKSGKPEFYDGGDIPINVTLLSDVGLAVVGILTHPEETKNRQVYISSAQVTQKKLLELAQKAAPNKTLEPYTVKISDVEKSNEEATSKGDFSQGVIFNQLYLSIFGGKDYGTLPGKDDNALLGIKPVEDEKIVALWKKILA